MEGREGGRRRGAVVEMRAAGEGEAGKVGELGSGEQRLAPYLLRLPAPPAPPSLGTFCYGLSTSYA